MSGLTIALGELLPLTVELLPQEAQSVSILAESTISGLALLGGPEESAGGAGGTRRAARITIWDAFVMATTANGGVDHRRPASDQRHVASRPSWPKSPGRCTSEVAIRRLDGEGLLWAANDQHNHMPSVAERRD